MESRRFRDQYRALLTELDDRVTALRRDVDACQKAQPPAAGFDQRAQAVSAVVDGLRAHLRAGAEQAALSPPEWTDRDGLEAQAVGIAARLREREAKDSQINRLKALANHLRARKESISHKIPRQAERRKDLCNEAAIELDKTTLFTSPPSLPGPQEPADWVRWLYQLDGEELQAQLDEIGRDLPLLAAFLESWEPDAVPDAVPAPPPARPEPSAPAPEPAPEPSRPAPPRPILPSAQTPVVALLPAWGALPEDVRTFEAFGKTRWVSPAWRVEPVPWHEASFREKLHHALVAELRNERSVAKAWIFARALESLGEVPEAYAEDLRSAAALLTRPQVLSLGNSPPRSQAIVNRLSMPSLGDQEQAPWRLRLSLEALCPSGDLAGPTPQLDQLIGAAHFTSALRRLVTSLLHPPLLQGAGGQQVLLQLRGSPPPRPDQLQKQIEERRVQLHATFKELHNAAGGKIERTHCRQAWRRLIGEIEGGIKTLFPSGSAWDVKQMRRFLAGVPALQDRIAEEGEVKFQDRARWDRAATRIYAQALEINELAAQLEAVAKHDDRTPQVEAVNAARQLLDAQSMPRDEEALVQRLLRRLVDGGGPYPDAMALTEVQLRPRLRGRILSGQTEETAAGIRDPIIITAAHLLLPVPEESSPQPDQVALRIEDRLSELRMSQRQSEGLALQDLSNDLKKIVRSESPSEVEDLDGLLLRESWLADVARFAKEQIQEATRARRARAGALSDEASDANGVTREVARLRQTSYRQEAGHLFPDPREALRALQAQNRSKLYAELLEAWLQPGGGSYQSFQKLRNRFCELFLSSKHLGRSLFTHGSGMQRNEPFRLSCQVLIDWLAHGRNPSFVPQLHQFTELVVTTPNLAPSDQDLPAQVEDLASRHRGALMLVLLPGLTPAERAHVQDGLRRSRHNAGAVVDDLDLCRLLNPDGKQPDWVLGLIEIALEQQRPRAVSPFHVLQGKNMHMEMFVGRSEEAANLAQTARYSRLFSGRKFGKTALLQHLQQRYDGEKLPSGQVLRILYLDMTGEKTEDRVVHRLREEMSARFKDFSAPAAGGPAPEALDALLDSFLHRYPEDDLLIVLDEVDTFVERQLRDYRSDPSERYLSWRMRRLEGPRIRFLFSGYRVTYKKAGAWSNWGDPLFLTPLPAEDAAQLVVGPLARLGVDGSAQAHAIAHRSGYQPVVLLRFGEVLLERLTAGHADGLAPPEVTALDVAAAFEDRRVQESIQRVTWDNFEGNPRGGVFFGMLLRCFAQQAPWSGVPDAPAALLQQVREHNAAEILYPTGEEGALGELRQQVQLFVDRGLLLEKQGISYLRFPYHLDTLRQGLEEELRKRLQDLRGPAATAQEGAETTTFFSRGRLEELRGILQGELHPRPDAVVAASHFPESLQDDRRGLVPQMEIDEVLSKFSGRSRAALAAKQLFLKDVPGSDELRAIMMDREAGQRTPPLFLGGADLLRWALSRGRERTGFLEILTTWRIEARAIERWFHLARGFTFVKAGALGEIAHATAGIPFALRILNEILDEITGGDPTSVATDQLDQSLHLLPERLRGQAADLRAGLPAVRLSPREIDVLRMLATLKDEKMIAASELRLLLTGLWSDWAAQTPARDIRPLDEANQEDQLALEVVERLGLIPVDAARRYDPFACVALLRPDDALYTIVKGLAP